MECRYFGTECEYAVEDYDGCDANGRENCYEFKAVIELQKQGHTAHCSARIRWGDSECECKKGVN